MDNKSFHIEYNKSRWLFICFFVLVNCITPKISNGQVTYTRDYQFKEGIYLGFKYFRINAPVAKSHIISKYDKNELGFFDQLTAQKTISYKDSTATEIVVSTQQLWGYSKNNGVYINFENSFYRLGVIGSLCHFVASVVTYVSTPDPFYGFRFTTPMYTNVPVKELRQFVLDMETGEVFDFNVQTMEQLLTRDDELQKEFAALKNKKKRESIFLFLRKYNEKHPLVFPE